MHWADSLEKIDAGKDWGQEEKEVTEDEMDGITDSVDMSFSKLGEMVKDRGAWRAAVHRVAKSWTWLNWRATTVLFTVITVCASDL